LLVPVQTQHAHAHQSLAAGEADGRLQEEAVGKFNTPFLDALLQFIHALRRELHQRDHVGRLRERKTVLRVLRHAVQMGQIVVERVIQLGVHIHQPAADGAVGVWDRVDGEGAGGNCRSGANQ